MRRYRALFQLTASLGIMGLAPQPAYAADDVKELAKLEKKYEKELKRCREGDRRQCDRAKITQADIEALKRAIAKRPPD
ncbi:MAG: hypothetical protein AAF559_04435 [Pseudomonadota bacterium]